MTDKVEPIPAPGPAEHYYQQKLNEAHHMVAVLLEANAGLQAKVEELEKAVAKSPESTA